MKLHLSILIGLLFLFSMSPTTSFAQTDTAKRHVITTYSGAQFIGTIVSDDSKEIVINTTDRGKITIPKYEVKKMEEVGDADFNTMGDFIPKEVFSTRYFITTNGLPIKRGDNYVQWNFFGPDLQFGVGENLGVGIMTTWVGIPLVGTIKYSIELDENTHVGVGALLGTGSWISPDFGFGLPFAALTFGDRRNNLNISGGYGFIWGAGESYGTALTSIAGMTRLSKNISFVFDSFIVPSIEGSSVALLIPGLRFGQRDDRAWQFGFGGAIVDGEAIPLPIPVLQWYWKI